VRSWRLQEIETPEGSRSPVVLHSSDEGRAVLIGLNPGQELGDHQVKEHVFLVVVDGTARIEAGDATLEAGAGTLVAFEPDERRVVASEAGAKIVLLFAPWPGEGHYRGGDPPASAG
jgi:quercetin dioxygenase-like cupin family protein